MPTKRHGLRRRREQLGFTQESAAEALGVSVSTYRSWELGTRTPRVGQRRKIARVFEVSLVEVDRWFGEDEAAPAGIAVPAWLGAFGALEQAAGGLCAYEPSVLPGLLQTAAYAADLQRRTSVPHSEDEVDRFVAQRLARQEVLDRRPHPLELSVVFPEPVLHNFAGDGAVMASQLAHLVDLARRRTIDVRVLPPKTVVSDAAFGYFTLLIAPESARPFMVVSLDRSGAHYSDKPYDIEPHVRLFEHLQRVALPPAESVDLIRSVRKDCYT